MNILIISATYPPSINGVAISTERSVGALRNLGHKVMLVIPSIEKSLQEEPKGDCYFLPSLPNPYISNYKLPIPVFSSKLKQWLERKKIDIVHVHHPFGVSALAKKVAEYVKCPLVFTYHTRYGEYAFLYSGRFGRQLINRHVLRFCNNDCDGIIATTQNFQRELVNMLKSPVYYASTAGLTKKMKSNKTKVYLRRKLGLPQNKNILLSVSRHAIEKNLDLLVKVIGKLNESKFHLVMVGDGPYNAKLRQKAEKMGVAKKLTFVGFVEQAGLASYYSSSDLFLYSPQTDTIGINILEAMSAGLPVIAVDDPNTSEVVKHKINGYLFPSIAKIFASHIELLFDDKNLLNQLKKNAEKIAQKFMIKETTKELTRVYSKIIADFST